MCVHFSICQLCRLSSSDPSGSVGMPRTVYQKLGFCCMSNQSSISANFQYCTLGVAELQVFEDPGVRPTIFGALIDLQHLKLPLRIIIDPLTLTYLVSCITFWGLAEPFSTKKHAFHGEKSLNSSQASQIYVLILPFAKRSVLI